MNLTITSAESTAVNNGNDGMACMQTNDVLSLIITHDIVCRSTYSNTTMTQTKYSTHKLFEIKFRQMYII